MQLIRLKIIYKFFLLFISCFLFTALSFALEVNKDDYAILNNKRVFLAVADTPEEHQKGLMFIKKMPEDQGMIFLFDSAEPKFFWMKNVEISLDIIFLRKNKIVNIHKNVPLDVENKMIIYKSVYKSDAVIEVNGGFCNKYNINTGDFIKLSDSIEYK